MKYDTKDIETKMQKSIAVYEQDLAAVRVGKASAAVLNRVTVDYYGSPTAIKDIAQIKATDARTLVIQPWDKSMLKAIEKAILASDVGITPQNDGKVIRLSFPPLTEERRKELAKLVKKYAEETKVQIRNARRDGIEAAKTQKKTKKFKKKFYQ